METYQHLSIKEWALEDRPREKLISKGLASLSDAELLAILIGSGSARESAVELSKKILRDCKNNLHTLGKKSVNDLKTGYHGIGEAKAISIVASLELGRRRKLQETETRPKISCSKDVSNIFQPILGDIHHEEFWVLMLNRSNQVIAKNKVSQGGLSGTVIDVRLILKSAIDHLASSIVLCHNHPSGNVQPSDADTKVTKKMSEAGRIMDIPVLDHIIVTDGSYFSYADEGMI
ncbi:DNA repair protein RadC [Carboxylicivirga sediminis]|uniref:DNA repair protein RadC n=1 Tax=Carboxylicivirga sediminis TaxID=2006564 RepID=A0A941IV58_9BACT|nr:DNA repair protein RadC [Carboxylicivirga sediminis]MBR8535006.1 DNA repair protein RadC [Carboxylicivirga sediminis]